MESAADIAVPSERVRGEGGGPPIELCDYIAVKVALVVDKFNQRGLNMQQ